MNQDNIAVLFDTLSILETGRYQTNGKTVDLKLSRDEMLESEVLLPEDVDRICSSVTITSALKIGRCFYSCENIDSLSKAMEIKSEGKAVLVLNFANPVHPGGGVRKGSTAQEEDICRKSSLLLSLESSTSRSYYRYHEALHSYMGSDAIIFSPNVEIIKDKDGKLLDESVVISVFTCAAPKINFGLEGMSEQQYRDMFYNRIMKMLKCAAAYGYRHLVLGAWGCGAFGNDAAVVSDLFYKALKEIEYCGLRENSLFDSISFAVLSRSRSQYNLKQFERNFSHFYADEDNADIAESLKLKEEKGRYLDAVRGSLYGGAVGDALGLPVEFMSAHDIFSRYGDKGITEYRYDRHTGKALISDDTQMSLFTADGILVGDTRLKMRGIGGIPRAYVAKCYLDWLDTQNSSFESSKTLKRLNGKAYVSWLLDVPELYSRRAPGNTCLSALESLRFREDYLEPPCNDSKGCGGIMRVAPLGLAYNTSEESALAYEGAQLAAITHGHSLGYMSSAVLVSVVNKIVYHRDEYNSLRDIIISAKQITEDLFMGDENLAYLTEIIDKTIEFSRNTRSDLDNIRELGEGWVAEETLAIAIYCSLRHEDSFSDAVIAAVNHSGDSDSTGAVTGNILGAWLGYSAIEDKWKKHLELSDVILEMADDLCYGCIMSEYSAYYDKDWARKYIDMKWKDPRKNPVFFWLDNEEYGFLSNWYEAPFIIDDFIYDSTEQYFMAQKAKFFHDPFRYTAILKAKTAKECKALGKKVKPFDGEKWSKVRRDIMYKANKAKFSQNQELLDKLLDTDDRPLAEASPYDGVWGIKMSREEAEKVTPDQWKGDNLQGEILMQIREEYRKLFDSFELRGISISDKEKFEEIYNSSRFDELNRFLRNIGG